MVGRQADASSTSGVSSLLRNTRPRPVRTLVAVTNSLIGLRGKRSKSMVLGEYVRERIGSERIEIVGREQPRHHVHGDEHRRLVERPAAEQDVERAAPERAETRRLRDALPERGERRARAFGPAIGVAVGKHRGVHGAGRGAGNAVDLEVRLLQQPIEHAPREGAVRAPALQREVDGDVGGDF